MLFLVASCYRHAVLCAASPQISFTLLTVLAEWAAAATRFVSGPMALYHLWHARHTMPLGVCLIFILGTAMVGR
jgi:hypothetical protein